VVLTEQNEGTGCKSEKDAAVENEKSSTKEKTNAFKGDCCIYHVIRLAHNLNWWFEDQAAVTSSSGGFPAMIQKKV
jgi:hypothetical protein